MRLSFEMDTRDYDPNGRAFVRPSARGIILRGGKVAMVHSLKYDYYKFPGGGIEPGETPVAALCREVAEESGLRVIPDSIREFGLVHRVQKSDQKDVEVFIQDNYYYLCEVSPETEPQKLDDYEAEERFTLEYVDPDTAIRTNREKDHGPKDQRMLEREARVLELLKTSEMERIHRELEALCRRYQIDLEIRTDETIERKFAAEEGSGKIILKMNPGSIEFPVYRETAEYAVGKLLLPRLRLETDRLVLRRFKAEDAEDCFELLSDPVGTYMNCCETFTEKNAEFAQRMQFSADQQTRYMIEYRKNGKVIGTVSLEEDDSRAVTAMEIGYGIHPAYQRKGIAFEALSALLVLLRDGLGLPLVIAETLPENEASIGLLRKLGFRQEGLRHKAIWHDGLDRPVDLLSFYRDAP